MDGNASNQPGGRWLRCVCAGASIVGTPVVAATARVAQKKGHTERYQQHRADKVEHTDGDQAKVLCDDERANHNQCDGENSHDVLRVELRGLK